jgi:1,4-dihydroxy-2-naphthoyl-CoA hydrolase
VESSAVETSAVDAGTDVPRIRAAGEEFEGMLARGLTGVLGFRPVVSGPDEVVLEWTVGPEHLQPFGLVHGGVHAAAVETVASFGGQVWYGDRGQVVGVSNQTDF